MSSWIPCVGCGKIVPSLSTHEQSCRPSKTREQEMKDREEFLKNWDNNDRDQLRARYGV
jgi:hypothetical protein